MLNRRRVLAATAGALALGAFGSCGAAPPPVGAREPLQPEGRPVTAGMDSVYSAARGRDVRLAVVTPTAPTRDPLPVCLVLHGRDASAKTMLELGLPSFLAGALRAGSSPFALVAVDGGAASYWLRNGDDDPQAMLREELPTWLPRYGLAPVPDAVAGISMGGFGALVYARTRAGRAADARAGGSDGAPAVAAISPALFRSWAEARTRKVFADEPTWAAAEPLRHRSGVTRLGVWCGQADRYLAGARQLASAERAAVARFGPGRHDVDYWRRAMPEALDFLMPPRT